MRGHPGKNPRVTRHHDALGPIILDKSGFYRQTPNSLLRNDFLQIWKESEMSPVVQEKLIGVGVAVIAMDLFTKLLMKLFTLNYGHLTGTHV